MSRRGLIGFRKRRSTSIGVLICTIIFGCTEWSCREIDLGTPYFQTARNTLKRIALVLVKQVLYVLFLILFHILLLLNQATVDDLKKEIYKSGL